MNRPTMQLLFVVLASALTAATAFPGTPAPPWFTWSTVMNNNDPMPDAPLARTFNSYNQPAVNVDALVVVRARSRGGGGQPATHGIYMRDMGAGGDIVRILDRTTAVPDPNNLGTKFVETPSFPRIDMRSDTIATRGNHPPVWDPQNDDEKVGTTGIYTNPFGTLITGASKLGAVPGFAYFEVPGAPRGTMFDVFPGAPAVTDGSTIVFKGNYTVEGAGKTGVFYRELKLDAEAPQDVDGGTSPVRLMANNTDTYIPGTNTVFGSTSPPSAADGQVVFAGFDNEETPTRGGIYRAALPEANESQNATPDGIELSPLVSIGDRVPGEAVFDTFNRLGEGVAFDGRYVGFWGAWGSETRTVRLYCPTEGNRDRIDYCNQRLECAETNEIEGDKDSICNDTSDPHYPNCYQDKEVPVHQGIFVHDGVRGGTKAVAKTGARFDEFVFWNYSGKTPCTGSGGHGQEGAEDDGEPAHWRSSSFVAVSGLSTAFKAATGGVVGIYFAQRPGQAVWTVLDTTTDGPSLDPLAPSGSTITELGLEREGLRGDWLAVSAKMGLEGGTEEEGMAGIYLTRLPAAPTP